jgi:hypothetical protein
MLLVPASSVFTVGGRTVVYRQEGAEFVEVPVDVIRRGRDQIALKGVNEGDRLAVHRPDDAEEEAP